MSDPRRIDFTDREGGGDGFAGVRVCGNHIGLTVSLEKNGDIEVFLDPAVVSELVRALEHSVSKVRGNDPK